MTTEEKARAYDEAIGKAQDIFHTSEFIKITDLFPDLAKSEDERIRKAIRVILIATEDEQKDFYSTHGLTRKDCTDWLEKQKDASKAIEAVDRIDKYIDENVANAHDMKDSNPDKQYYRGWDEALGEMAGILQDVYSGEKQKDKFADETMAMKDKIDEGFTKFMEKEQKHALKFKVGDKVYTSGLTEIVGDIFVGEIEEVLMNEDGTAKMAKVNLLDNGYLNYVGVVKKS